MNETMNQLPLPKTSRVFCLALGLCLAFACQSSNGQSAVTPPKVPPYVAGLQAKLNEFKREKTALTELIAKENDKLQAYDTELEKLRKRGATLSVSAESYPEILKTIHSQRVQLSIDLAGLAARHDAILKAIDRASEKLDAEVLKPYKRLVQVREADLERSKDALKSGQMSAKDLQKSEVELLNARLRLAEASKPSGAVSYLNSQLLDTSLELAEKTARLEKAQSLFKDVEKYQTFKTAFEIAQGNRQEIARHRRTIEIDKMNLERTIESTELEIAELTK